MPFGLGFHPGNIHVTDIHPTEALHPSEPKASRSSDKPSSPVVTSGHDPFSSVSFSGLPSSSTPVKSGMQNITLRNRSGHYAIKADPDAPGPKELYQRDPDTDAPIPTGNYMASDGDGGWGLSDAQGAAQGASRNVSTPGLPPQAKIDPAQLGSLKEDGTFPGQDGNSYVRSGDGYHPASYDKQLQGWRMVDPDRPNDFSKSVPVKLDGKDGAEALPRAWLKGGLDPMERKNTKDLRIATARERVVQAEARAEGARVAWQHADQHYHAALALSADVSGDLQRTSSQLRELNRQRQRLNQSRNREQDPVRLHDIDQQLAVIDERIFTATSAYNGAYQASVSADRNLSAATTQSRQASDAYQRAWQGFLAAQDRFNHVLQE
jgi:hypothetical protein